MTRSGQSAVLPFSIALALMMPALPQTITTGEVTGTVLDATEAVIANAAVKSRNVDTGDVTESSSTALGIYRLALVKPGNYEISAASTGLKSDVVRLVVAVGQVQVIDLHLTPAPTQQTIEVTDAAPLLDTDNANIVYTLSTRQLELLPLPGEDLISVAYAIPGVAIVPGHAPGPNTGTFATGGLGTVSNLFTINGADETDPYTNANNSGATGLLLGANEIKEVSVVQNPYEGQYGRQAGAQVNYVTKSGTDAYHGNLLYNYNGTPLNANGFFANSIRTPRSHQVSNQYAASLGGFALKDKLFFFADTEGMRYEKPIAGFPVVVPSPALETYTLANVQGAQVPVYQQIFDLYNNAPGHQNAVPVTTGRSLLQDGSGKLGCGDLAGTPTGAGGTFGLNVACAEAWATNATLPTSEWLLSSRLDYNINSRQRVYFHFRTDHGFLPAGSNPVSPVFSLVSSQPDYEGQMSHTWIITPRLVNNLIGAGTYNDYVEGVADLAAARKALPFRLNFITLNTNRGSIASMGLPSAYPQGRRDGQLQAIDDISYQAGRHSLKAGLNYRYNRVSDVNYQGLLSSGAFAFLGLAPFASGELGPKGSYTQSFTDNAILHLNFYTMGAYVQDQWAATPRLKVTASLRFERTRNPDCVDRCYSRLIAPFQNLDHGPSTPYNQAIQTGLGHAFYQVDSAIPQPRVGFSYAPPWLRKTVLRGGIGLFADGFASQFFDFLAFNPPNVFTPTITTGLVEAPGPGAGPGSAPAIAAASANAFRSGFASGATLARLNQAVSEGFSPPTYYSVASSLRTPRFQEWSFEIQRQLGARNAITLRYAGNHGYDLLLIDPGANIYSPTAFGGLPTVPPDPRFGQVYQVTNAGHSNYNAFVAVLRQALGYGFQGQAGYTWSHALDTGSNGGLSLFSASSVYYQINPLNLSSLNYSNADYDARHNLTADLTWEVPRKFGGRIVKGVFSGWSMGGRINAHSGFPFSVEDGNISPVKNFGQGLIQIFLADLTAPVNTSCTRAAVITPCFTPSQFAKNQNDFGNVPRNSFRAPGLFNIDLSVYKTVPLGEKIKLMLGGSAYNLLNHANFAAPNAALGFPTFGQITSTVTSPSGPYGDFGAGGARVVVVGGRVNF